MESHVQSLCEYLWHFSVNNWTTRSAHPFCLDSFDTIYKRITSIGECWPGSTSHRCLIFTYEYTKQHQPMYVQSHTHTKHFRFVYANSTSAFFKKLSIRLTRKNICRHLIMSVDSQCSTTLISSHFKQYMLNAHIHYSYKISNLVKQPGAKNFSSTNLPFYGGVFTLQNLQEVC